MKYIVECDCECRFHPGIQCSFALCLCHEDHPNALVGPLRTLIKKEKK